MSTATSAGTEVGAPRSRPPRRRSLYRGDPGMWSWVLHRITGATIFFFLFVHVLDTALVRVSPAGLQRGHRDLQDADRRADGVRPGGRGALPRAQRPPGHPDRLLVNRARATSGLMLWIVVGVFLAVMIAGSGRARHAHGGAVPVSAPWTPTTTARAVWQPVLEREHDRPAASGPSARTPAPEGHPVLRDVRLAVHATVRRRPRRSRPRATCSSAGAGRRRVPSIDFAFVAGRWASPFWQIWDLAHAVAGHAARRQRPAHHHQRLRRARTTPVLWLKSLLLLATGFTVGAGHAGDLHLRPEHPLGRG